MSGEEVAQASEEYRNLIWVLTKMAVEGREKFIEKLMASFHPAKTKALADIMAKVKSNAPAPAEALGAASALTPATSASDDLGNDDPEPVENDWPLPNLGQLRAVEPFPIDVLPDLVARFALQAAESIGCPVDFVALAAIVAAAAAIGRSVIFEIKEGYKYTASLFAGIVGRPGQGKTPAIKAAMRPLRDIDTELYRQYVLDEIDYRSKLEEFEEKKRNQRRRGRPSGPAAETGSEAEGQEESVLLIPPERPVRPRCVVEDATVESLCPILADNPRGLAMIRDELRALITSMNQYRGGKGADQQFFLSIFSGSSITVDRKSNDRPHIYVADPFLSIFGGLNPDVLSELGDPSGKDVGFSDRFLISYPDPVRKQRWNDKGLPKETALRWDKLVRGLHHRPFHRDEHGREAPTVIRATPGAMELWKAWIESHYAETNADDFRDSLWGPWAKLEQYAGRLALILHLMHHEAECPFDERRVPDVDESAIQGAIRLIDYFKSHARRVESLINKNNHNECEHWTQCIRKWVQSEHLDSFSERDLGRQFKELGRNDRLMSSVLNELRANHIIRARPAEPRAPGKRGRKPSPIFDVNSHLLGPASEHGEKGVADGASKGQIALTRPSPDVPSQRPADETIPTPTDTTEEEDDEIYIDTSEWMDYDEIKF